MECKEEDQNNLIVLAASLQIWACIWFLRGYIFTKSVLCSVSVKPGIKHLETVWKKIPSIWYVAADCQMFIKGKNRK